MRTKLLIGFAAAGLTASVVAQTGADLIKERQAGMKAIGAGFKGLMDQTRGGSPDLAAIRRHAAAVAALSPKVPTWFAPGTQAPAGTKTGARPEIWTQQPTFRKAAAEFDAAAKQTLALANAGDMNALGQHVRALGGACKGCHDQFRRKDD